MLLSPPKVIAIVPIEVMVGNHMVFHAVVSVAVLFPLSNPVGAMSGMWLHELLESVMIHWMTQQRDGEWLTMILQCSLKFFLMYTQNLHMLQVVKLLVSGLQWLLEASICF